MTKITPLRVLRARFGAIARQPMRLYVVSAVLLTGALSACTLSDAVGLDTYAWDFHNREREDVRVTPLYRAPDGAARVVPRFGWRQTEFGLPANGSMTITLETGDFPFDLVLVETSGEDAWLLPVSSSPVEIRRSAHRATPEQLAAKWGPSFRRLRLYLAVLLIPLVWVVPAFLIEWHSAWRLMTSARE